MTYKFSQPSNKELHDKEILDFPVADCAENVHKKILLAIINSLPLKNTIYTAVFKRKYEGLRRLRLFEGNGEL